MQRLFHSSHCHDITPLHASMQIDLSGYVELDDVRSAVVSVVKNYLDIATWPEDEDRLQWTVRFHFEAAVL